MNSPEEIFNGLIAAFFGALGFIFVTVVLLPLILIKTVITALLD